MALDSIYGHVYVYITFEFQVFFFFYLLFFPFYCMCVMFAPSDARCQGLSMCGPLAVNSSLSDVEGKERSIIFYYSISDTCGWSRRCLPRLTSFRLITNQCLGVISHIDGQDVTERKTAFVADSEAACRQYLSRRTGRQAGGKTGEA